MKKILFAVMFLGSTFASFSQTPFPNADFENWSTTSHCGGEDSLDQYFSEQNRIYYETSLNNDGICPDAYSNIKSTNAQSGSYALRVSNLIYEQNPYINGQTSYSNYITLGVMKKYWPNGPSITYVQPSGIPFTDRPTKLTGYYKLNQKDKRQRDVLDITVSAVNANGDLAFNGHFTTSADQSTYKKFTINVNYNSNDQTGPVTLYFIVNIGNHGSVALIDNLAFEYDVTTGTSNPNSVSPINVYAANNIINFSENVSDVHVVDMIGAQKISASADTKALNAASLIAGMYIVTYRYNDAYFSKKIIIE